MRFGSIQTFKPEAHLRSIRESGDEGARGIETVKVLEMNREARQETVVIDIETLMKIVVDVPETIVELVPGSVGEHDHEPSLVGELGPAVVVSHLVVVAAVPVQHHDHWGVRRHVLGNEYPVLAGETVMLEVDVLSLQETGGRDG